MNKNFLKGLLTLTLVAPVIALSSQTLTASAASHVYSPDYQPSAQLQEATVTIDNVTVVIRTPYPISSSFTSTEPGDAQQGGGASENGNPFNYLAIIAVPFGTNTVGEAVPTAEHGDAQTYLDSMRSSRKQYEGEFQPNGPVAILFGQKVTSQVTLLSPFNVVPHPQLLVEWVVEAGPRIWLVRVNKELPDGTKDLTSQAAFLQSLESLTISSNNLDNPSTLKPAFDTGTGTIPGMPNTGSTPAAGGGMANLPALLAMLVGGLLALTGVVLRSGGNFRRER